MNDDIKADNMTENEQSNKILGYVKTLLSSINIIEYRSFIDLITQRHLSTINSIEFTNEFTKQIRITSSSTADSSDDDSHTFNFNDLTSSPKSQSQSKIKFKSQRATPNPNPNDAEISNMGDSLDQIGSIDPKYLPKTFTNSSIKSMVLSAKERNEVYRAERSELLGAASTESPKRRSKNKSSEPTETRLDDYFKNNSANMCKCRINLISSKGRIYKKKANSKTPNYYYLDDDGYYYGEECTNVAMNSVALYCKNHEIPFETGKVNLISMPPMLEEPIEPIEEVKQIVIRDLKDEPLELELDIDDSISSLNSSVTLDYVCSDNDDINDDVVIDFRDEISGSINENYLIKYNHEGHLCWLNKRTQELLDYESMEFLGTLDDDDALKLNLC